MDFLAGLVLQAGVGLHSHTGDSELINFEEKYGYHLKLKSDTVYAWGSYVENDNNILGQGVSDVTAYSYGLGVQYPVVNKLSIFAEAGYSNTSQDTTLWVQQEVAYTYLVGRHNVHNRPVPVDVPGPYVQDSYETTYDIKNGVVLKVGLEYEVNDWFSIAGAYRFNRLDAVIEIYDEERRANGGGWWMEHLTLDNSAFELQLLARF